MKRLPILFSIVLLVVSAVAAQKNPEDKTPVKQDSTVVLRDGPVPSKEELAAMEAKGYPNAPYSIMKESLVRNDGTVFNISDFRGTVVVLHLFATWSGPDRAEIPRLKEIQTQYKDSGLKVIGVNVGDGNGSPEDRKAIAKFAKKHNVNYDLVQEVNFGKVSEAMVYLTKFDGVPQTILIDREGKLRGVFLGGEEVVSRVRKETIDKLMSEK